jgi:phenylacetic acid degradation operon negative regulatory protein
MSIQTQAEDWLCVLMWGAETMMFPSFRNLTQGYEPWAYQQRRFKQQFRRLEQRKFISRHGRAGQLVYRLTRLGRLAALGDRDPETRWRRAWDGRWRIVVFDLPVGHQRIRQRFLRWLRQNGFGYLQDSVWIHTDPVKELTDALKEFRDDVESLTVLEARCCAGYSDAALVKGAWPFDKINTRYLAYLQLARSELGNILRAPTAASVLNWLHRERAAWKHALAADPLLPRRLHPDGYLGEQALGAKRAAYARVLPLLGVV